MDKEVPRYPTTTVIADCGEQCAFVFLRNAGYRGVRKPSTCNEQGNCGGQATHVRKAS